MTDSHGINTPIPYSGGSPPPILIDTNTDFIAIDPDMVFAYWADMNQWVVSSIQDQTQACAFSCAADVTNLPDFTVTIKDPAGIQAPLRIVIPREDMLQGLAGSMDKYCLGGLQVATGAQWILGANFITSAYVVFNATVNEQQTYSISFAEKMK